MLQVGVYFPSPQLMAKALPDLPDEYTRNARLKPAFLVGLPVATLAAAWGLKASVLLGSASGPLAAAGLTYLLAHLSRDLGQRKQVELFQSWGGKPSVAKLRHRDATLNLHTRARYHEKAAQLFGKPMPTAAEEAADPTAADLVYESYCNLLLERTRDTKAYRLLFEELMSYGFRRNLLGMKPIGLSFSAVCTGVEVAALAEALRMGREADAPTVGFLAVNIFLLACWILLITPDWVKRAADSYADRLLAASESLPKGTEKRAVGPGPKAKPARAGRRGQSGSENASASESALKSRIPGR